MGGNKRPQSNYLDTKSARSVGGVTVIGPASAAIAEDGSSSDSKRNSSPNHHARSASLSGVGISTGRDGTDKKQIVEEEPELDIDIAKAYCELTEGKKKKKKSDNSNYYYYCYLLHSLSINTDNCIIIHIYI